MRASRLPGLFALAAGLLPAQNSVPARPPIIDIHVHAAMSMAGQPACANTPAFLASDPKQKESNFGWKPVGCANPLLPAKTPDSYEKEVMAEMERLNVTAVVMGTEKVVNQWKADAPNRVIRGTAFDVTALSGPKKEAELKRLRDDFTNGGFQVMGEIGLQYQGMSPSDPAVDEYFALAEELDIPVGIHMGTGGSGRANLTMPKFRGSMGDPLLLEGLLAKHPKLRLWIMHAGYPMIDNLLTLLQANSHVYVDVAGLIWSYPIKEVNRYIQRIVEAGFEDRVMFGTDQLLWPNLMAQSINIIDTAEYLTPEEKRDILYNNAARFLRLDQERK
ncbi:MAG TPA: amidohydrolase family protein [Bryobacteraceae bacterium]|nr:amidohydrolase family protein [Bryobacteraceae bacterium]